MNYAKILVILKRKIFFSGALFYLQDLSKLAKLKSVFSSKRDMNCIFRWCILEALEVEFSVNYTMSLKARSL